MRPYPFEDFLADFDAVRPRLVRGDVFRNLATVNSYMIDRYPNRSEKRHKTVRFMFVMEYLANHIHELDQSDYAVYGSETAGAIVNEHLLRAVHELFTARGLKREPTPAEVMELADKYREQLAAEA